MDRSEPSFIPGWLKGTATDEGGSSRTNANQKLLAVGNNLESPRKSTSSSKAFSSSSRRSNINGTLDRGVSERDHFGLVRSKSNLNRTSSIRSQSKYNLEQNGYKSWLDGDSGLEVDRRKDWLSGMVPDRERESVDSALRQLSPRSPSGKYEVASKMNRSQSMGVSSRLESGSGKLTEMASMLTSSNGYSAKSLQKTGFGHNFPSAVLDDSPSSPQLNIASPRPSAANSNHVWQGISRSDLSRSSSPGLVEGSFVNPISASIPGSSGGSDLWSSALADVPTPNTIVQSRNVASNASNVPSVSQTSTSIAHGPVTSVTPLNMAEALIQNPPRVRTPPQLSVESQRLEELALKQSRQLIPVTPSLPKIMTLGDKGKCKTPRGVDSSTNPKSQLNSLQKSAPPSSRAIDSMKPSQRELCVLRPGKDGVVVSATTKSDGMAAVTAGSSGPAGNTAGVSGPAAGGVGGHGRPKQAHDRRASSSVPDRARMKDAGVLLDDRRLSLHAQNKSDFFNALRRKAAGNGVNGNGTVNTSAACEVQNETADPSSEAKGQGNGVGEDLRSSQLGHTMGDVVVGSGGELLRCQLSEEKSMDPGLEAEEAAFLRSLGWEENAEDSELTEEEINAFFESLPASQREKLFNSKGHHWGGPCAMVGSVVSTSELSCSD